MTNWFEQTVQSKKGDGRDIMKARRFKSLFLAQALPATVMAKHAEIMSQQAKGDGKHRERLTELVEEAMVRID